MVSIIALPLEILSQIPRHLHHLDDFLALESMCRHLRAALGLCAPGDLLALCYRLRATFFRPEPQFLLSALIPAIRQYACSSEARRVEVKRAIWHGCDGLLEWACHTPAIATYAGWSTRSVHDLWEWRMRVLNPLSDLVDKCIGRQWYSTPDFWNGGVEDAYTIQAEPETQVFELQMYGDMFGAFMNTCVTSSSTDPLGLAFRLDFVKYLIPDWLVRNAVMWEDENIPSARAPSPTDYFITNDLPTTTAGRSHVHPLRAVQTVFGPYINRDQGESQKALLHLIKSSPLWGTLVCTLRARCGPDFWTAPPEELDTAFEPPSQPLEQWKQELWEACPYALGSSFLEMLAHVWHVRGAEEVELLEVRRRARLHERRQQDTSTQKSAGIEAETYDAARHAELQARVDIARAHPDLVETGTGWDTLRRWHAAIAAMECEPLRVRVGLCETHEGYPDLVGDIVVATRVGRGMD